MNLEPEYFPMETWGDPLPLPSTLLPVKPFDSALLPDVLRSWVEDIAERMQCPPDFPAVGTMVALSSIIGRKACIAPKQQDDWNVIPNLWGAIVGRPGVMKSPALAQVLSPLHRLQAEAHQHFDAAIRDFEVSNKMAKLEAKVAENAAANALRKGDKFEAESHLLASAAPFDELAPVLRRYLVNDSTMEALGEVLMENPNGTLIYQDEIYSLLKRLDKEGQEGARGFYLQAYDGNQGYTFDRIMRGRNLRIPSLCLSILGGIQPARLQSYVGEAVSGGAGDDGLLQRFGLMVWPDVSGTWRDVDRWPDTAAKNRAFEVFQRLDALEPATDRESGEQCPLVYRFTPQAQHQFGDWRHDLERELRSSNLHPALESHLAKYRKLVPALALICALADAKVDVDDISLMRALAWSEYLRSHAERIYHSGTTPSMAAANALLSRIKKGQVGNGFSIRDVYRHGWSHLGTTKDVSGAIEILMDMNVLAERPALPGEMGGRPTSTYRINPAVLAEVKRNG
jgi:putative DNA primase/helicase